MPKLAIDSDGWIVDGPALNVYPPNDGEEVEYDGEKDIESTTPSKVEEAWNWNDGSPEIQFTGSNIPPEADEARNKILTVAKNNLDWDQSKVRSLRNNQNTNLFFDYLVEGNYEGAKGEIDWVVNNTDLINSNEGQTFKDALDGKI